MKNVIYYFTGTGNSLAIAKNIAAALGDCELVPIASLTNTTMIAPVADRVGIVCPVYFLGLPLMVAEFAGRFDRSNVGYTFAAVTYGGSGSEPTLRQLDDAIKKHDGRGLDAGFSVKMPGNYILMYESLSKETCDNLFAAAEKQLAEIVPAIRENKHTALPRSFVGSLLHAIAYPWFVSHARTKSREFTISDACTSCGTCAAICPAENIEIVNKKPVWKDRCELCLGCLQLCPAQAIQAGPKTAQRSRYHNPEIALAELKRSNK